VIDIVQLIEMARVLNSFNLKEPNFIPSFDLEKAFKMHLFYLCLQIALTRGK
jgi:hypothetical protein